MFSANDVIANLGVISAGVLVFLLDSRRLDLVIGVFTRCVARGKMILEDAEMKDSERLMRKLIRKCQFLIAHQNCVGWHGYILLCLCQSAFRSPLNAMTTLRRYRQSLNNQSR